MALWSIRYTNSIPSVKNFPLGNDILVSFWCTKESSLMRRFSRLPISLMLYLASAWHGFFQLQGNNTPFSLSNFKQRKMYHHTLCIAWADITVWEYHCSCEQEDNPACGTQVLRGKLAHSTHAEKCQSIHSRQSWDAIAAVNIIHLAKLHNLQLDCSWNRDLRTIILVCRPKLFPRAISDA